MDLKITVIGTPTIELNGAPLHLPLKLKLFHLLGTRGSYQELLGLDL